MMRTALWITLALSFTLAGAPPGHAGRSDAPRPALWLPPPTGPFAVGVRTESVIDPSRIDDQTGRPRRIPIWVWYPARHCNTPHAPYLSPGIQQDFEQLLHVPAGFFTIDTHACSNAPPRRHVRAIILVQPGGNSVVAMQTAQIIELASHGYFVVGMDHPHESVAVEEADGTRIYGTSDRPFEERLIDGAAVLAELERLVPEAHAATPIAMFGHSRGAEATADMMLDHPEIVAGIALDGGMSRTRALTAGLDQPFGFMLSNFNTPENLPTTFEFIANLRGPHVEQRLDVEHNGYNDFVIFNPQAQRVDPVFGATFEANLQTGTLDNLAAGLRALHAERGFLVRFMGRYLD